jgi:hypothetical protein
MAEMTHLDANKTNCHIVYGEFRPFWVNSLGIPIAVIWTEILQINQTIEQRSLKWQAKSLESTSVPPIPSLQ